MYSEDTGLYIGEVSGVRHQLSIALTKAATSGLWSWRPWVKYGWAVLRGPRRLSQVGRCLLVAIGNWGISPSATGHGHQSGGTANRI